MARRSGSLCDRLVSLRLPVRSLCTCAPVRQSYVWELRASFEVRQLPYRCGALRVRRGLGWAGASR